MDNSSLLLVLKRMESKLDCLADQNRQLNSEMKEMLVQIAANKCPCLTSTSTLTSSGISSASCNSNPEVDQCIDLLYHEAVETMCADTQLIKAINPVVPAKPKVSTASTEPSTYSIDAADEKTEKPVETPTEKPIEESTDKPVDKSTEKTAEKSPEPSPSTKRHSLGNIVKEKLIPALKLTNKQTTSKAAVPEVKSKKTTGDANGSKYYMLRSRKVDVASGKGPAAANITVPTMTTTTSQSTKLATKKGPKKQTTFSGSFTSSQSTAASSSGSSSFNRRAAMKKPKAVQQPARKSVVVAVTQQLIANGAAISPISRLKQTSQEEEEVVLEPKSANTKVDNIGETATAAVAGAAGDPKQQSATDNQYNTPPNNFDNLRVADRLKAWEFRSTKKF